MKRFRFYFCSTFFRRRLAQWKPNKPVHHRARAAGGSTEPVTRITAAGSGEALGRSCDRQHHRRPGSIGTKGAWEAPKDGYTWTAGAAGLGVYRALGMLDTNLSDWNLYLSVANVAGGRRQPRTPYRA